MQSSAGYLTTGDSCFSITESGQLGTHTLQVRPGLHPDAGFKFTKCSNHSNINSAQKINVRKLSRNQVAISPDGKIIFTGGHWDNSVRGYSVSERKTIFHSLWHSDIISCLAIDRYGRRLITGSVDRSCCIWIIGEEISSKPAITLYGHKSPVVDVAISSELDMCVTAGADGICNVHTVRKGVFVRTLSSTNQGLSSITALSLSSEGYIVFSSLNLKNEMSYLHLYSVNGKILAVDCIDNKIELIETENDRLVTADRNGLLEIRCLTSLEVLKSFSLQEKIYDVNLTKHGSHILVGCGHGEVCILGPVSQTL